MCGPPQGDPQSSCMGAVLRTHGEWAQPLPRAALRQITKLTPRTPRGPSEGHPSSPSSWGRGLTSLETAHSPQLPFQNWPVSLALLGRSGKEGLTIPQKKNQCSLVHLLDIIYFKKLQSKPPRTQVVRRAEEEEWRLELGEMPAQQAGHGGFACPSRPPHPHQGRAAAGPGSKCWAGSRLTRCRQLRAQVGPRGFRQHDHFLLCFSKRSKVRG